MPTNKEVSVHFDAPPPDPDKAAPPRPRRFPPGAAQRPQTATAAGAAPAAPFLDARGNRTQPSRDEAAAAVAAPEAPGSKKKRRPKTAIGMVEHPPQHPQPHQPAGSPGGPSGSEPNFPTLNPRVFHALRGFLTPESLRKTKFYSDREDRMSVRREQLDAQQRRLGERIGGFYQRLDSFIADTNAAANWEPEDRRKQRSLLDDLDNL